jgi:hypothetical protein
MGAAMKTQMTWVGLILISIFCLNAFAAESASSVLSAKRLNNRGDKTGQFGLGAQVGSFSGISSEFWTNNDRAIEASFAFRGRNSAVSVAHNWFARGTFSGASEALVPVLGVGGIAVFGNGSDALERNGESFAFGVQIPVGMEYLPPSQRFALYGKVAPSFEFTPIGVGFVTGDLGARFYF